MKIYSLMEFIGRIKAGMDAADHIDQLQDEIASLEAANKMLDDENDDLRRQMALVRAERENRVATMVATKGVLAQNVAIKALGEIKEFCESRGVEATSKGRVSSPDRDRLLNDPVTIALRYVHNITRRALEREVPDLLKN